jgi:hypothetical protein
MVVQIFRVALLVLAAACGGPSQGKSGHVVVADTAIEILDPVSFAGAELAPASHKILDAVVATLNGDPSITLVEVEVHVAEGDAAARQDLADRRGRAIVDYLIGKGLAPTRLRAKGIVAPPEDPKSYVSFVILERG